jgi:hypothetical protein
MPIILVNAEILATAIPASAQPDRRTSETVLPGPRLRTTICPELHLTALQKGAGSRCAGNATHARAGASAADATCFRRQRSRHRPAFDPGQACLEIIPTGHNEVDACCHSALIRHRKGDGAAANYRPCLNVKARPRSRATPPSKRAYHGEAAQSGLCKSRTCGV